MELIKQLNEMADELMDEETFARLVQYATQDIKQQRVTDDDQMLEIIHSLIEDVAGYEETEAAVDLANRVLASVKSNIA